jgi:hypothetical protein
LTTLFWVQNSSLENWFKPRLDPTWAILQIPHRFLNI